LDKVSLKIDKWHIKNQNNKEELLFSKDEEYVELDRSPTNFETSSEEDDSINN
jgi:hypothetical protein